MTEYPVWQGMPEQQTPPPQQPASIRNAVRLMRVGAVLSALSLILTLATHASLKSHIRKQVADSSTLKASDVDNLYHAALILAVVSSIIAVGLWLWMAWKNSQGLKWARVVATVLGAINLFLSIYTVLAGNAISASLALTAVNLILAITILAFLWTADSSAFYAETSRRHTQFGG